MKIDIKSILGVVLSDVSFPNASGLKNHLGYLVFKVDDDRRATIAHYGSSRCHRLTRSVMVAEVHALIHAVDVGILVQDPLSGIHGRTIKMGAFAARRNLFNIITKIINTA